MSTVTVMTSPGVIMAARIAIPATAYRRLLLRKPDVINPSADSTSTTTGSSKMMPNASSIFVTNEKYRLAVICGTIVSAWKPIRNWMVMGSARK